mmetsp:Transcript_137469/g.439213  ORF Transcript_137469/g.439213 Transcript_137469/m.439213 type:complete len:223 (-) Transcript_137469:3679-4347(-)
MDLGRWRRKMLQAVLRASLSSGQLRPRLPRELVHAREVAELNLLQEVGGIGGGEPAAEEQGQVAERASRGDEDQAEPAPDIPEEASRHAHHLRLERGGQEKGTIRVQEQGREEQEHGDDENDDSPIHPRLRVQQENDVRDGDASTVGPAAHDQLIRNNLSRWPPVDHHLHGQEKHQRVQRPSGYPSDQGPRIEVAPLDSQLVQARNQQRHFCRHIDVEDAED